MGYVPAQMPLPFREFAFRIVGDDGECIRGIGPDAAVIQGNRVSLPGEMTVRVNWFFGAGGDCRQRSRQYWNILFHRLAICIKFRNSLAYFANFATLFEWKICEEALLKINNPGPGS